MPSCALVNAAHLWSVLSKSSRGKLSRSYTSHTCPIGLPPVSGSEPLTDMGRRRICRPCTASRMARSTLYGSRLRCVFHTMSKARLRLRRFLKQTRLLRCQPLLACSLPQERNIWHTGVGIRLMPFLVRLAPRYMPSRSLSNIFAGFLAPRFFLCRLSATT